MAQGYAIAESANEQKSGGPARPKAVTGWEICMIEAKKRLRSVKIAIARVDGDTD